MRELDVLLNGEDGAAAQASLSDLVSQVHTIVQAIGKPLLVSHVKAPIELTEHQVAVLGRPNFEQRVENDIAEETRYLKNAHGSLLSNSEIEAKAKLFAVRNNMKDAETVQDLKLLLQLQADLLLELL